MATKQEKSDRRFLASLPKPGTYRLALWREHAHNAGQLAGWITSEGRARDPYPNEADGGWSSDDIMIVEGDEQTLVTNARRELRRMAGQQRERYRDKCARAILAFFGVDDAE